MRPFQKSRRFDTRLEHVAARSLRAERSRTSPDRGLVMSCPFRMGGTLVAPSVAPSVAPLAVPLDVPLDVL